MGAGRGSVWNLGMAGAGVGVPEGYSRACSPRKRALAALFTSAEWHLASRAGDSLFPPQKEKGLGVKKRGFAHCLLIKSL